MIEREEFITDDHLDFLNVLRETGSTNMFAAVPYIKREFPNLSTEECRKVLRYWMKTFNDQ